MDESEIINVDSDSENETVESHSQILQSLTHKDNSGCYDLMKSFVSARTDGIRGNRYADYIYDDTSEAESGELSGSSESDIDVCGDDVVETSTQVLESAEVAPLAPNLFMGRRTLHKPQKDSTIIKNPNHFQLNRTSNKRSLTQESPNTQDVYGIASFLQEIPDPILQINGDGIEKLIMSHRNHDVLSLSSSDDEALMVTKENSRCDDGNDVTPRIKLEVLSDSSEDLDYCTRMSTVSDLGVGRLNLKDHINKEQFPEVEIIDLTLSGTEEICTLGAIYQIVNDFVVIKSGNPTRILDIDSMVFDENRKCVGYIFEVLGPVSDPYYSIHFNTNSDIQTLGLFIGQNLFYSPNEKYSRYLLVEFLKEFESRRYRDQDEDDVSSQIGSDGDSGGSDSSESYDALLRQKRKLPRKCPQRPRNHVINSRSTNNYTVNYQTSFPRNTSQNTRPQQQPARHYNSFTEQWNSAPPPNRTNVSRQLNRSTYASPAPVRITNTNSAHTNTPKQPLNQHINASSAENNISKQNTFRNSVLSSFMSLGESEETPETEPLSKTASGTTPTASKPSSDIPPAEMFAIPSRNLTF